MKRKILFPIILLVVLGGIAAGVLKSRLVQSRQ